MSPSIFWEKIWKEMETVFLIYRSVYKSRKNEVQMAVINIVSLAAQLYIRQGGVKTPEYRLHENGGHPREPDPFRRIW
jgi:hypothetical protein